MTIDPERFEEQPYRASVLLSQFAVPFLLRNYHDFEGDMLLPLIIGEIGLHNVGRYFERNRNAESEEVLYTTDNLAQYLRPCNALSISAATGIPRETVRRKVDQMIKLGWIIRDEHHHLYTTPAIHEKFGNHTLRSIEELMQAADRLKQLLGHPTAQRA